jgi:type VI secretion system protein ImpC
MSQIPPHEGAQAVAPRLGIAPVPADSASPDSPGEDPPLRRIAQEFRPRGELQRAAVEGAVRTLAEQALMHGTTVSDDAYASIEAVIAAIDAKLTEQINLILHHEQFQALEAAWRGLHHLVSNTETDDMLKIRFMDLSKEELRRTMRRYKGVAWDQSPLFKRLYEDEYGQLGGEPYGCVVADYYFDHGAPDVELLGAMARVCAAAHAPLLAGASPSTLQMQSWQELANPRDLAKITGNLEHVAWNSLRDTEDARYVGLAMPRFLARLPYGARTHPVDEFHFEERTDGSDHRNYVWANAAYALAVNINRSFKEYGWCSMIRGVESGGTVEGLPCHTFPTDDGGFDMKCPTEIAISDRREAELARAGFIPLVHRKGTPRACCRTPRRWTRAWSSARASGCCAAAGRKGSGPSCANRCPRISSPRSIRWPCGRASAPSAPFAWLRAAP